MTPNDVPRDDADRKLAEALHAQAETITVTEGWSSIMQELQTRERPRTVRTAVLAAVVVVLVVAGGVAVAGGWFRPGGQGDVDAAAAKGEPFWPYVQGSVPAAPAGWSTDADGVVRHFTESTGLDDTEVTAGPDGRHLRIVARDAAGDRRTVATVGVSPYPDSDAWGITSVGSSDLKILFPARGDVFDPPLSVRFRSATRKEADVSLRTGTDATGLGRWTGTVDGGKDWTANANVTLPDTASTTPAFVLVVTRSAGTPVAASAVPVGLGSAGNG